MKKTKKRAIARRRSDVFVEFRGADGVLARVEPIHTSPGAPTRLRRIGIVEEWLSRGVIDQAEHDAADRFRTDYHHARLEPRYATMQLDRVLGGGGEAPDWIFDRQKRAYASVQAVLRLVGGRAGPLLVAVVGEGRTMRDLSISGGIQTAKARATLCMAFDLMATHYLLRSA